MSQHDEDFEDFEVQDAESRRYQARQQRPFQMPRVKWKPVWLIQAERWWRPSVYFDCCGTRYVACTKEQLELMRRAHGATRHPAEELLRRELQP